MPLQTEKICVFSKILAKKICVFSNISAKKICVFSNILAKKQSKNVVHSSLCTHVAKIRFSFVTSKKLTKKNSLILDEKRIKHLV